MQKKMKLGKPRTNTCTCVWMCFLFNSIIVTSVTAQYYRPEDQPNRGYGASAGSPYGGQDGRTYYATGTDPQQGPGYQPGQSYDAYGRQTYGSPVFSYGDTSIGRQPTFPVRSRGPACSFPSLNLPQVVTVKTKLGEVMGKYEYLCDSPKTLYEAPRQTPVGVPPGQIPIIYGNVSVFLGIPYSTAPIRERRFRPPEAYRGWHRLEAFSYRPACPQPPGLKDNVGRPVPMDEDCLYLNIFAPTVPPRTEPYPVMIYIHGGEFESGTAAYFPGHMLAAALDVVVVTFNYRLGALGFFSTGNEESPGNYGMLDQSMAIRWVYDNIAAFFGNPLKITLFGPDAGAASAGLHMVSPRTRDLFQNVIAQSGSAVADWGAITNLERARNTSRVFAEKVGCDWTSSRRLVECLRNRSPRELTEFNLKPQLGFFPWVPVVDKNISMPEQYRFLPESPRDLIRRGQFDRSKLYVTGVTRDEGAYLLLRDLALSVVNYQVNQIYFRQSVRNYVKMYNYSMNADGAVNAILYAYTNWADPKNESLMRDGYINMLSDAIYKAPVDEMVKLLTEQGVKTYMYVMNTTVESQRRPYWQAVPHNIEWYFITGAPFLDDKYFPLIDPQFRSFSWTDNDRRMSDLMMSMWANVARHRNPVQPNTPYVTWYPAQQYLLNYLSINTTRYSFMFRDYRQTECAFWNYYMPTLLGPAPPTYPPYLRPWWQYEQPLQIGFWSAISVSFLLVVMLVVVCCMYCRIAGHDRTRDVDFDGSLPPDDYSLTHPIESETAKINNKYDAQHTSV